MKNPLARERRADHFRAEQLPPYLDNRAFDDAIIEEHPLDGTSDLIVKTNDIAIQIKLPQRPITDAEFNRLSEGFDKAVSLLKEKVYTPGDVEAFIGDRKAPRLDDVGGE